MNSNFKITEEILLAYTTETISESDKSKVEDWIKESEENRKYVEKLRRLWANGQSFSLLDNEDLR